MSTHSFRTNDENHIVEDCLKLVGRMTKTELVNNALYFYYEKLKGENYSPYCLPNPKIFEQKLRNLSDAELDFYIRETSRLYNITKWIESDRKAQNKKRKELMN